MKILSILLLCNFQACIPSDCKFWPYWNRCDRRETLSERFSCCSVLQGIFGGSCPDFCMEDGCNDSVQKIRNWCGLIKINSSIGRSCEIEHSELNSTKTNEIRIFHSCCEPDHKDETIKQCYGDYDETEVTIHLRKTYCPRGYSGWTCSGDFIRKHIPESSTKQTTKPTTDKPSTTTTKEESTTSTPSTTTSSSEYLPTADDITQTTPLPDTTHVSTSMVGRGTTPVKSPFSTLIPIEQNSENLNIANTVTLVGGVVGGLLGGILVVLIWWGCRRRRQRYPDGGAMMPMSFIPTQTPRPVVVPDLIKRDPLPPPDHGYSNPYEEVLADQEPRYATAQDLQEARVNYVLAEGLSDPALWTAGRDGTDGGTQADRGETPALYFVLESE